MNQTTIEEDNSKRPIFIVLGIMCLLLFFGRLLFRIPVNLKWWPTLFSNNTANFKLPPLPSPSTSSANIPFVTPSDQEQKWLFAAGGILSARNHDGFDQLKVQMPPSQLDQLLQQSWDIHDRVTALKQITWLKTSGHTAEFEQLREYLIADANNDDATYQKMKPQFLKQFHFGTTQETSYVLDFTWKHRNDLADKQLIAWDEMRLINVSRWTYSMGYITEQEAWENMIYAGKQLQSHYHSWEDLADNYLLGRSFWHHSDENSDLAPMIFWLENEPTSPWKTIPFALSQISTNQDDHVEEDIECGAANCSMKKETMKVKATKILPNNFPNFLSIYSGSTVSHTAAITQYQIVEFSTASKDPATQSDILNFYKDQLQKQNWYLVSSQANDIDFTKGEKNLSVSTRVLDDGTVAYGVEYDK